MDRFFSDYDCSLGKVIKRPRLNPVGESMYLRPDGTIESDEAKIVKVQQIFKHNYYRPGGKGAHATLQKYESRTTH